MGNRIRELRNERKLSLRQLAQILNMSFSNIATLERGESQLREDTTKIFADFFNVSSDYLLGLSDQRESINANTYHERLDGIDFEIIEDIKSLDEDAKQDLKTILKYLKNKGEI